MTGRPAATSAPELAEAWRRRQRLLAELDAHRFRAPWWLRNPHLQTVFSPLVRRSRPFAGNREVLATPDGDRLHLLHAKGSPGRPRVLVLHGLEGSRRSHYVAGIARAFENLGWRVTLLEFRSCSGELNRARRLYHSGETTDLALVVDELLRRGGKKEDEPLYVAGFSLGGNVVAKWLGERGDDLDPRLSGAAVVSPPFDLEVSGPAIDRALGGLYVRRFLRTLIPKAIGKERQFPGCLDIAAVRRSRTFEEFDTYATAALHGFADAWDYWRRVGCGQFLPQIRRPTLLVAADDDPFNPASTLPHATAGASPYLYPQFTRGGGHVGFVYGAPWRSRHWAEEQVVRFFVGLERGARTGGGLE